MWLADRIAADPACHACDLLRSTLHEREPQIFSYEEALDSFPLVRDLTPARYSGSVPLQSGPELGRAAKSGVRNWRAPRTRYRSVGGRGQHAGLRGQGTLAGRLGLWRRLLLLEVPEEALGFFHGYDDGFRGRVHLA